MEQLGEVEDKYITEAAPKTKSPKKAVKWAVIGAMGAAAAGVIVWQGVKNIPDRKADKNTADITRTYGQRIEFPENTGELEIIRTTDPGGEGMGFEGFTTYDVSTLLDGNPSRENCEFTELPVFIRPDHPEYSMDTNIYSIEEMDERLRGIASQLTGEGYVKDSVNKYKYGWDLSATAGDIKLDMDSYDSRINVNFETAVDLPDEFGIYTIKNDDKAQIISSLEYLGEKYGNIFGLYAPVPSVFIDYDIYNNPSGSCYLYDDSDDPLTALLNYNFQRLSFAGEEIQTDDPDKYSNPYDAYEYTGDLATIYYSNNFSYLEFTGMYPVISYDEAYEKLVSGDYYTTVWEEEYLPDGINTDEVTFTGINYKRTSDYKYELPYYRFLIELHPERSEDMQLAEGMREFGAFYVPAVSPEYLVIENTDVAFN